MKRFLCVLLSVVLLTTLWQLQFMAAEEPFTLSAGKVQGTPGDLIQVPLTLSHNPGIISVKTLVAYDSSLLSLEKAEPGVFKGVSFGPITGNPFTVNWMDALQGNNTANGELAVLTFRIVAPQTHLGTTPITLTVNGKDVFNQNFTVQPLALQQGEVEILGQPQETPQPPVTPTNPTVTPTNPPAQVEKRQMGDVDENGTVNAKDALTVLKATVGKLRLDVFTSRLADCNGDGLINAKDALCILRYSVGKGDCQVGHGLQFV